MDKQANKPTELLKRYKHLLRGGRVWKLKYYRDNPSVLHPRLDYKAALKAEKLKVLLARLGTGAVPVGAGAAAYKKLKKKSSQRDMSSSLDPAGKAAQPYLKKMSPEEVQKLRGWIERQRKSVQTGGAALTAGGLTAFLAGKKIPKKKLPMNVLRKLVRGGGAGAAALGGLALTTGGRYTKVRKKVLKGMSGKPLSEDEKWFIRMNNPSRSVGHEMAQKYYQQTGKVPPNLKYLDKAYTHPEAKKTAAISVAPVLRNKGVGRFPVMMKSPKKMKKPGEKILREREQAGVSEPSVPGIDESLAQQELDMKEIARQIKARRVEDLEEAQTRLKTKLRGLRT
tara:strand:+ start:2555 stop:3571 length:1017 start_codon:yes stop_codon:yes gene_type:complete